MVFKKAKKGQAAIEFLMTYGWMLLIVLIVGALIFSFVDFGSLLPNQLDLTNSLRADQSQLIGDSTSKEITVVFTYVGAKAAYINLTKPKLVTDLNFECNATTGPGNVKGVYIKNIDTGLSKYSDDADPKVNFINGQMGIVTFDCTTTGSSMIEGDTLEGNVVIPVTNTRSGLDQDSRGRIRVSLD